MWSELSKDAGDIQLQPPNFYAAVASIRTSHAQPDILSIAQKHGLDVYDYREEAPSDGYRQVALMARATQSSSIPWSLPWPLSVADDSHITRAWTAPPEDANAASPIAQTSASSNAPVVIGATIVAVALGGLIWWAVKR